MSFNENRARVAVAVTTFRQLGIDIPKKLAAVYDDYSGLNFDVPLPAGVGEAIVDAVKAGKDPAALDIVQRAAAATFIANRVTGLQDIAADRMVGALDEHAPDLHKALASFAAPLLEDATRAHDILGGAPLDNTPATLGTAARNVAERAQAWAAAKAADQTLPVIEQAWRAIWNDPRGGGPDHGLIWFDLPELHSHPDLKRSTLTVWDALNAGATLSLADGPEFDRRFNAAVKDQRDRRAARLAAQTAAHEPRATVRTM